MRADRSTEGVTEEGVDASILVTLCVLRTNNCKFGCTFVCCCNKFCSCKIFAEILVNVIFMQFPVTAKTPTNVQMLHCALAFSFSLSFSVSLSKQTPRANRAAQNMRKHVRCVCVYALIALYIYMKIFEQFSRIFLNIPHCKKQHRQLTNVCEI